MQQQSPGRSAVANLTDYRKEKSRARQATEETHQDAEETITEIARYVLLIVDAITRHRHTH